jgi:hypothetical protein
MKGYELLNLLDRAFDGGRREVTIYGKESDREIGQALPEAETLGWVESELTDPVKNLFWRYRLTQKGKRAISDQIIRDAMALNATFGNRSMR